MFSFQYGDEESSIIQDQINTHRASFRYNDLGQEQQNINFEGKKVLLFVSVGQEYHEKGKFLATIELINKYPFAQCDIVLADTLQRFNHYGRLGEEQANLFTVEAGKLWLKRSAFALNKLTLPHRIIHWDELLNHEDYASLKTQIVEAYQNDETYKEALHKNVSTYIERLKLLNPVTDEETLFKNGLDYLIEECPIVMPMWAKMGYDYIVYPKPLTPGMSKTRDLFVTGKYDGKCQWLFLRFKKR